MINILVVINVWCNCYICCVVMMIFWYGVEYEDFWFDWWYELGKFGVVLLFY